MVVEFWWFRAVFKIFFRWRYSTSMSFCRVSALASLTALCKKTDKTGCWPANKIRALLFALYKVHILLLSFTPFFFASHDFHEICENFRGKKSRFFFQMAQFTVQTLPCIPVDEKLPSWKQKITKFGVDLDSFWVFFEIQLFYYYRLYLLSIATDKILEQRSFWLDIVVILYSLVDKTRTGAPQFFENRTRSIPSSIRTLIGSDLEISRSSSARESNRSLLRYIFSF